VHASYLEKEYRAKPFPLLGLEEYAELVVDFLERLDPAVFIERLFGTAPKDQLIGPVWGKSKAEIRGYIERTLAARNTYQGSRQSVVVNR
jgi:radical SAM superfamily enzyme